VPELSPWLERFAWILGLEPGSVPPGCRRLHFVTRRPSADWKSDNLRLVTFWYHPETSDIYGEMEPPDDVEDVLAHIRMSQALFFLFHAALLHGGMPLHAAVLEYEGRAVAIAAPGGTGKTTCAERVPAPWKARADDLCLVVPTPSNGYAVHPLPTWSRFFWGEPCDDRWTVTQGVPLHAIFFLEQADADGVRPVGIGEATAGITGAANQMMRTFYRRMETDRSRTLRRQVFENACNMAGNIPAYQLRATLDGRFWEEIEAVL
jgi:SynChlorMet cassette protein ScmC